ncbi:MAG: cation diffusion facilitator family transporter [Mycobacteriales bacterium]
MQAHRGRLVAVLSITLTVLVVEVIGGLLSGSLALLADAGHLLTDAAGVGFALFAAALSARPATPERTFGYHRAEILAAVANAVLLLGVAVFIVVEAFRRMADPAPVTPGLMLGFAVVGLLANGGSMLLLYRGQQESLNVRGAYLEVFGDLLGSAAVIVAAVVIMATGWTRADPIASVAIAALIVPRTWRLLREAVDILLEATPKGVDTSHIRDHITGAEGVHDVHDLHVWTITSGLLAMSAHVVVTDEALADGGGGRVLDRLGECLGNHFEVEHCTFQLESTAHRAHEQPHCD